MRSKLISQFLLFSEQIRNALLNQDYSSVRTLDLDRRSVLEELCTLAMKDKNQKIFSIIENAIEENTSQISDINSEIKALDLFTAKKSKMLDGYKAIN